MSENFDGKVSIHSKSDKWIKKRKRLPRLAEAVSQIRPAHQQCPYQKEKISDR